MKSLYTKVLSRLAFFSSYMSAWLLDRASHWHHMMVRLTLVPLELLEMGSKPDARVEEFCELLQKFNFYKSSTFTKVQLLQKFNFYKSSAQLRPAGVL